MLSFAALYSLHFIQIRIMVQEIRRKLPKTFSELWGQPAYLFNLKIFHNSLALLFARDRCHLPVQNAQNGKYGMPRMPRKCPEKCPENAQKMPRKCPEKCPENAQKNAQNAQ